MAGRIRVKCSMSMEARTGTKWLSFEPDPDHSPDPGPGLHFAWSESLSGCLRNTVATYNVIFILSLRPSAVCLSWHTLVCYDPVQLLRTKRFSAPLAAVHCLRVICWRPDQVVRRVIRVVREWYAAPCQHGQQQCHGGYQEARSLLTSVRDRVRVSVVLCQFMSRVTSADYGDVVWFCDGDVTWSGDVMWSHYITTARHIIREHHIIRPRNITRPRHITKLHHITITSSQHVTSPSHHRITSHQHTT